MSDAEHAESSDGEQVFETNEASSHSPTVSTPPQPEIMEEKPQPSAPEPHWDLFFDDGNILIVAGNTSFRVHRSVLSRKSALFKDLLSLPQPETEEKIDGLPVVPLLDPAEDVYMLLDAIYNGAKFRYRDDAAPSWSTVHKLLVLGTKYQVEELREEAIYQLNARYPKKIVDWDYTCRNDSDTSSTVVVSYPIEEDLIIANVARTMDLPDIHLAALYGCCSLPFDVLVRGRVSEDGSVELLCQEDLIACLQGKENLLVAARSTIRMDLFLPEFRPISCRSPTECSEKVEDLLRQYRTAEARPSKMYDPLRPDDQEIERNCTDLGLCHECIKFYLARHAALRQDVRNNLASYICATKVP